MTGTQTSTISRVGQATAAVVGLVLVLAIVVSFLPGGSLVEESANALGTQGTTQGQAVERPSTSDTDSAGAITLPSLPVDMGTVLMSLLVLGGLALAYWLLTGDFLGRITALAIVLLGIMGIVFGASLNDQAWALEVTSWIGDVNRAQQVADGLKSFLSA